MVYREACALHLWKWSFREDVCTEARALLIVKAEFKLLNLRQLESRLIWLKTKIELVTGLVRGLEESRINIVCDDNVTYDDNVYFDYLVNNIQFIDSNVDLLVKIPPVNRHVGEWINLKLALDPAMPLPVNDDVEWQKIRVDGFNGRFKGIFEPLNLSLQLWHPSRTFIF